MRMRNACLYALSRVCAKCKFPFPSLISHAKCEQNCTWIRAKGLGLIKASGPNMARAGNNGDLAVAYQHAHGEGGGPLQQVDNRVQGVSRPDLAKWKELMLLLRCS